MLLLSQSRMIPDLCLHHLGCDRCMNMTKTEKLKIARKLFTFLIMRTYTKIAAPIFLGDLHFAKRLGIF